MHPGCMDVGGSDRWVKSSFSANGQCVEVSFGEGVRVRNSRDPGGPVLAFTGPEWVAFVAGVRAGEFDGAPG
jgi:hypothetical protein